MIRENLSKLRDAFQSKKGKVTRMGTGTGLLLAASALSVATAPVAAALYLGGAACFGLLTLDEACDSEINKTLKSKINNFRHKGP